MLAQFRVYKAAQLHLISGARELAGTREFLESLNKSRAAQLDTSKNLAIETAF
ncbi:hypothetical protein NKH75_32735 [Mesorhizobium sp. M0984]|uniref:hypothetical protein n=1 Tax=unclassified Mesorhizobium TaxID=325217 RepID=UPI00333A9F57